MDVIALVHGHDREPVARRARSGAVEDEAGIECVRREDRRVHRADRDVRGTGRGILGSAPHVKITLVPAHEGSEHRSVALERAVPSDVVPHARGRILNERAFRPRRPSVVRLGDIDVVLAEFGLGELPEAHVDGLLSARDVPLPVELGGREGERGPVITAIHRDRHRGRAEPEARHVDAPRGLDTRHACHRRHDEERIAERQVDVAASQPTFRRRIRRRGRTLGPVRLTLEGEGCAPVVGTPEVHTTRHSADGSNVNRAEAVDLDLGLEVLVDEDGAAFLVGEVHLWLEAEVEVVVGRLRPEIIRRLGRARHERGGRGVRLVDRTVDEHRDAIDVRSAGE